MKLESDTTLGGAAFVIRGFLTPAECEAHMDMSEELGYEPAPINTGEGAMRVEQHRSNSRVVLDDPELAERLYERLRPLSAPPASAIGTSPASTSGFATTAMTCRKRSRRTTTARSAAATTRRAP